MMTMTSMKSENVLPFETVLDKIGFGYYQYLYTFLSGLITMAFFWVAYNTSIIIPASACELGTTSAQQGLMGATPVIGSVVGTLMWGYLADTRGRRKMLMRSLFLGALVNAVASLSVHWIMLVLLQFSATVMVAGQYPLTMSLLSESIPMANRNLLVLLVNSLFMLSQGLMAATAMPIIPLTFSYHLPALGIYWNSWRTLLLIYSIPSLIALFCLYFMKESPKFLLVKGDEAGAIEKLKYIYSFNKGGKTLEITGLLRPEGEEVPLSTKEQIKPLFRMPLLKSVIILTTLLVFQLNGPFLIWLPRIANQFVNILHSGEGSDLTLCKIIDLSLTTPPDPNAVPCSLNVTALTMVVIVGALQCGTNVFVSLVIDKVGRRNMVMIVTFTCGLAGVLVNVVPNAIASASLFVINLVGQITLGLYAAIAVSIVPTQLRAMSIAFSITADRICSFASIQVLNYLLEHNYCEVGFYVYSSIFASSALVASFLIDDRRGRKKKVAAVDMSKM